MPFIQSPAAELRLPDTPCTKFQREALLNASRTGLVAAHKAVLRGLVTRELASWGDTSETWVRVNARGRFYTEWLRRERSRRRSSTRLSLAKGLGPDTIRVLLGADPGRDYLLPRCLARTREVMIMRKMVQGTPDRSGYRLTAEGLLLRQMLEQIAERYRRGQNSVAISADLDVTSRTVQRWLTAMGLELRRTTLTDRQRDAIARSYVRNERTSVAVLAAQYSVSTTCIKNALKKRQVTLRPPGGRPNRYTSPANRQETRHS